MPRGSPYLPPDAFTFACPVPRPLCLITGGTAGIGYAAAVQSARAGAEVVIASRSLPRGEAAAAAIRRESASDAVSVVQMDLSSRASIRDGCRTFRDAGHDRVDVLIHNAADFDVTRTRPVDSVDGVETVWATNHVGPVILTQQLEAELLRSAQGRVVTVSSQGLVLHPFLRVRLRDPEFREGGFRIDSAYYQSKLAQTMYTFWLADRFRGTAVTANCVRVTNVKVDLARYPGLSPIQRRLYAVKRRFSITPAEMAEVYTWLALSPALAGVTGAYVDHRKRRVSAGRYASDPAHVRAVMECTARYVPGVLDALDPRRLPRP